MLLDTINLLSTGTINNATIEAGIVFPSTPVIGRLFYLSLNLDSNNPKGLYAYNGTSWESQTGDITSVVAGTGLTGGGTIGAVTLNVDMSAVQAYDAQLSSLVRQVSQSANYTLTLGDSGKHLLHPSADTTARTFTIPANSVVAFPLGTVISFINQNAAGVLTIAITTDTMRLAGAGTVGSRSLAANGIASVIKITATEWIISGTNLT